MSFKNGDKVVRVNKSTKPKIWTIDSKSDVFRNSFVCSADGELLNHFHEKELRYAELDEIKDGKRL